MIEAQELADVFEDAVDLPSLPAAIVRLLSVVSDPNHSRKQVIEIVRSDPGLVAEALRMANSPMVCHRTNAVENADEAISILGEQWLMRAVSARALKSMAAEPLDGYGMGVDSLWEHSIRVALLAEMLASRAMVPAPVAYTAGLLVDVGKLVASKALAGLGNRLEETLAARTDLSFDAIERMLIGMDHAALGARVATAWGLPSSLCTAIGFHHRPELATEHTDLVHLIHAADSLAYLTGRGLGVDGMLYRMTSDPLPELVFDRKDVDAILLKVEVKVRHIEGLMA